MITEDDVREALRAVADPCAIATGVPVDVVAMGLVHEISSDSGGVTVTLRLTSPFCMQVGLITQRCQEVLRRLPGVGATTPVRVEVDATAEWLPEDMHPDARAALRRVRPLPRVGRIMSGPDIEVVPDYARLLRLDGRTFVVLGAGAGMGRQCAHALAQAGARVVCVDREAELAAKVAAEVDGVAQAADVTVAADLARVFAEAGPITGLVDVVGIAVLAPLFEFDDEHYDRQFDLVLRHVFHALRIGGRAIADAGGGSMVFIGSISGQSYAAKETVYGAAKAAMHRMVESAARELGPLRVRANVVAPGFTRTPRLNTMLDEQQWTDVGAGIPRGTAALPWEIAGPVLFLASELSSYLTGQTITVDGGMSGSFPVPF